MATLRQNQAVCNTEINYTDVITEPKILPFKITLDTLNSVLNPGPGENQKFCYIVTGVGTDTATFADLSHLVLGICDKIPESQITNITVAIDGVPQEVVFGEGGNVELRTPDNPDPTTGCAGLKFDFGLNKVGGIMQFCFELTMTYPVGPDPVCLFGGDTTATGLSICGPVCTESEICETVGYQPASVCVPVTVKPFAIAMTPITICCGTPVITQGTTCVGTPNGTCTFTVTQRICVAVPVGFGATTTVGQVSVSCETPSDTLCPNCTT